MSLMRLLKSRLLCISAFETSKYVIVVMRDTDQLTFHTLQRLLSIRASEDVYTLVRH